ncbi:hypothetical protein ABPG77_007648 [Micractinium sp. CCAP 211/92]
MAGPGRTGAGRAAGSVLGTKPPGAARPAEPRWATPGRLLALFCVMCLFIYMDRGLIASNGVNGTIAAGGQPGSGIQGDFSLTLFQDGLLPAAFMVGLLASSPIFAEASKHHNAFRLIGIGLAVWTAAAVGCGLAPGFVPLLLCRMAVGVGEASFVALAAPFIDDQAPAGKKALWLGVFYCCIPTGYALGYIFGGLVGAALGWRAAFLLEAAAMLPFVAFCLRAPPISLRGDGGTGDASASSGAGGRPPLAARLRGSLRAVGADTGVLLRHPVYLWAVGGMTFYTAVLGGFAFYGPKAGRDVFNVAPERADLTFGAITVLTGVLGTLAGGALLDAVGASMRNALLLCAAGIAAGSLLAIAAFWAAGSFAAFSLSFAAAELAMFVSQAPGNAVCMWSVPTQLRPFAMSMSVVAIHVLGDVPSPPLLGALQGWLQNWRLSMSIASALLLAGAAAYLVGAMVAASAVDYRELAAAADGSDPSSSGGGGGGGSNGGSRGALLAEARAAIVGEEADEEEAGGRVGRLHIVETSSRGEDDAEAGASPDRSLLPSHAQRSS